jgi:hypothetical protein
MTTSFVAGCATRGRPYIGDDQQAGDRVSGKSRGLIYGRVETAGGEFRKEARLLCVQPRLVVERG